MSAAQVPVGYIAKAESRSFSFEAHGADEHAARWLLTQALELHARQYDLPADWHEHYAEVTCAPFLPGSAFRDGEPMILSPIPLKEA